MYWPADVLSSMCSLSTRGCFTHEVLSETRGIVDVSRRREAPRARKSRGHACVPPGTHMPLRLPARGNTHTDAKPTAPHHTPAAPDTADRSTAWMWSAVPDTTEWRRRVGLGIPHRGKTCAVGERSASLRHVASREHDGRMAGREASAAVVPGGDRVWGWAPAENVSPAMVSGRVSCMRSPSHICTVTRHGIPSPRPSQTALDTGIGPTGQEGTMKARKSLSDRTRTLEGQPQQQKKAKQR